MDHLDTFAEYRSYLYSVAYRMLGSLMDTEDLLQETFLRWQATPLESVQSPKAFLATVLKHLCLNHLQSARVRREEMFDESPASTEVLDSTATQWLSDSLTDALQVLYERLPPKERVVFLLREVFDCEYDEIAAMIMTTATNSRQILSRAKKHLTGESRFTSSPQELEVLANQFTQSSQSGDLESLIALISGRSYFNTVTVTCEA